MIALKYRTDEKLNNMDPMNKKLYFDSPFLERESCECSFSPLTDISETENMVNLELEIPGLKKEDVKITVKDNILKIEGEKKREENKKLFRSERLYGTFTRRFTLSKEIDKENINAKFENGLLIISLNKVVPETREIQIN